MQTILKLSIELVSPMSFRLIRLSMALIATEVVATDSIYQDFRDPKSEYRPFVRWWWNGGRVEASEIGREIAVLRDSGIGGIEINTIAMPSSVSKERTAENPEVNWLSPEWCKLVNFAADEARRSGMSSDLLVGSGWPFGGEFLKPNEQIQRVFVKKVDVKGKEPTKFDLADFSRMQELNSDGSPNPNFVRPSETTLLFARALPKSARDGVFVPGIELQIDRNQSQIAVDLPAGDYVVYFGILEKGYTHVKLGAPGAKGPVLDHFSRTSVRKYLDMMSTALSASSEVALGRRIRAFFVDSLELERANWTLSMLSEFKKRRHYDVQPFLPFVLDESTNLGGSDFDDTIMRVRHDYCETLVELFQENFIGSFNLWAKENGVAARIQAYGREVEPLKGSMLAQLPEGETWLWVDKPNGDSIRADSRSINKYVSSAANLMGVPLRSFEAMTNTVPVFWETPSDLKRGLDASFVDGLNHPIYHGFNYSPPSAGFPGWVQFGNFLNERVPWWKYFRSLNDYAARVGVVMRNTSDCAKIAILTPRSDEWSKFGLIDQPFPEKVEPWYVNSLAPAIQSCGYGVDYVNDEVIGNSVVENGRLSYGHGRYNAIVCESVSSISLSALTKLKMFLESGGKVLFIDQVPFSVPGLHVPERDQHEVHELSRRISEVESSGVKFVKSPMRPTSGNKETESSVLIEFANSFLKDFEIEPDFVFKAPSERVSQISKVDGDRRFYFLINKDRESACNLELRFPYAKGRPFRWIPESGDRVELYPNRNGEISCEIEPSGSLLVVFEPKALADGNSKTMESESKLNVERIEGLWTLDLLPAAAKSHENRTLTVLKDLSKVPDDAFLKQFSGTIKYEISFNSDDAGEGILDLGVVCNTSEVVLNGVPLGSRWFGRHRYQIDSALRRGTNQLTVWVTTSLVNMMHAKLEDPTAQRWSWWAPPAPSGLIGPVRILRRNSVPSPSIAPDLKANRLEK